MRPINSPESNQNLWKTGGIADEQCLSLPVINGGKMCISCWKYEEIHIPGSPEWCHKLCIDALVEPMCFMEEHFDVVLRYVKENHIPLIIEPKIKGNTFFKIVKEQ